MNERHLYRGCLNNFEGSIDEDGKLYDERHRLVGRIEGNDVYDYCNIKQGTIDESGKLWDCNRNYVGEAHGNNFIGPNYRSTGMVRGDSFGEGNGCEYGALMMLKKRNEYYSGNMPDNNYNFPNNVDDEDDEEEEYEEVENEYGDLDSEIERDSNGDDEYSNGDDEWDDYALPHDRISNKCGRNIGKPRPATKKQGFVAASRPRPTRKQEVDLSYVPPDSDFSTGRKNEYRLNGITYVDVSGKSTFWTSVLSFFAGLNGKGVITGWDRISGTWDRMKQEAYRTR